MSRKRLLLIIVLAYSAAVQAQVPYGLVGSWDFNNGTANDASPVGANATLLNGAAIIDDPTGNPARGKVLDARANNGAARADAPDNTAWAFGDYATINAWVMVPTSADAAHCPWWAMTVGKGGNGTPRLFYDWDTTNNTGMYAFDYASWLSNPAITTNGTWSLTGAMTVGNVWHMITSTVHPAVDVNGNATKQQSLYFDGVFQASFNIPADDNFLTSADPFSMGGYGNGNWQGLIDDVGYWHGWLTADTIAGLYNGTYTNLTAPFNAAYPTANNRGDMNGDGVVDFQDLAFLCQRWLEPNCTYSTWCDGADLNHNGTVDLGDFGILADNWLERLYPPGAVVQNNLGGVPTFMVNGQWLTVPGYSCLAAWPAQLHSMEPLAGASPVPTTVFDFPMTTTDWPGSGLTSSIGPNLYNWNAVDLYYGTNETMRVEDGYSNSVTLPRIYIGAPSWWLNSPANAGELEVQDDGTSQSIYWSQYSTGGWTTLPNKGPFPSLASTVYRQFVKQTLEDFIDYAQMMGYLDTTIGFELSGLATEEWYYYGFNRLITNRELAGYSVPTQNAFRQWLRTKYSDSNSALQSSWNNVSVTFDNATVPTRAARLDRLNSGGASYYTFRNVDSNMNVVDFYQFWNDLVPDFIDFCAGVIKNKTNNTKLVGAFYAYMYEFTSDASESGTLGFGRFLQSSNLDYVYVTNSYFNRGLGKADQLRDAAYSARLHNKIWFNSDDTMTMNGPYIMAQFGWSASTISATENNMGYTPTLQQNQWMFRRQTGFNACNGFYQNHLELWTRQDSNGLYTSMYSGLQGEIGYLNSFCDRSKNYDRSSISQILIVADEYSCQYTASSALLGVCLGNPQLALQQIGAPADHILLNDLGSANASQYKLIVFLNCWDLTDAQRSIIDGLKNNNRTLMFCYAGGYFNGRNYSSSNMKSACGMNINVGAETQVALQNKMKTLSPRDPLEQAISTALSASGVTFGSGTVCAKRLNATEGTVLGTYPGSSNTSMAITRQSTWKGIWCATADMPAAVYRTIASDAGAFIYNNSTDTFGVNKSYMFIHASSAGSRTINFPRAVTLYDGLSEQVLGTNITSYTRTYQLGETLICRYE
jgi:hypothetical protein